MKLNISTIKISCVDNVLVFIGLSLWNLDLLAYNIITLTEIFPQLIKAIAKHINKYTF